MNSYITDKYAGMLTEEDVGSLFDSLAKQLGGNRSEAARRCGLTGKATYDWEQATYVKLETKKKVLEASLRENFLATVEYLLIQSSNKSLDLLRTILSTLYANALEAASPNEFKTMLDKFEEIRIAHRGLIRDRINDEIADMSSMLKNKASDLGFSLAAKSISDFSAEEMINAVQLVGHLYAENPVQAETFALKDLDLPVDALKPVIETFQNLCFVKEAHTMAGTYVHGETYWVDIHGSPVSVDVHESPGWVGVHGSVCWVDIQRSSLQPIQHARTFLATRGSYFLPPEQNAGWRTLAGKPIEEKKLYEITTTT